MKGVSMKLYTWPTSPFGVKVIAVAKVLDLDDQLEIIFLHPWETKSPVSDLNPLGKIPALICDDGVVLYDSPVLCEYLDHLSQKTVYPKEGTLRWQALQQQALADGVLDAAILIRYESLWRPQKLQSKDWIDRQHKSIHRSLDQLEREHNQLSSELTIGTISVATTLSYLDLRSPETDWRKHRPHLKAWYEQIMTHEILQKAKPEDSVPLPENLEKIKL